ncbi:MAG: hypothetical protein RLZ05_134 [Bacteroidota bacterium]|jgi:hypothetical protein
MKNIAKLLLGSFLVLGLASCDKEENQIAYLGGTNPVLSTTSGSSIVLLKDNRDQVGLVLNWTNPNYKFTTGVSSQDVTYLLQVDTVGGNFSSPNKQEVAISKDLGVRMTVKDLNTVLGKMELRAGVAYNVQMRVRASLVNGTVPLFSNVLGIRITPYLDFAVEPPGTAAGSYNDGGLWALGDAFASGWSNPMVAPYNTTQKFRRDAANPLLYIIDNVTFNASGFYKLIQTQGVWGTQYRPAPTDVNNVDPLAGEFEKRDADPGFKSPGAGNYKVEFNFQTGKYKLTRL